MIQFLPRGYRVSDDNRIKKLMAFGCDWQIYLTNLDVYVLAVKPSLYDTWISKYSLPANIFQDDITNGYSDIYNHFIMISVRLSGQIPADYCLFYCCHDKAVKI